MEESRDDDGLDNVSLTMTPQAPSVKKKSDKLAFVKIKKLYLQIKVLRQKGKLEKHPKLINKMNHCIINYISLEDIHMED